MKTKDNKAITLIALIITIIILLILAGASINFLFGADGILTKSQTATNKYKTATEDEQNMIDSWLSIADGKNQDIITSTTREEMWNGATMLTTTISNISGGTFTINVNNVEAHNYGTLYYYVNNTLVYQGPNSSFQVTNINGTPLKDGTTYQVKVLAEPFTLSVTTEVGDNIQSWLACIGNTNNEQYGLDNLDEMFQNTTLMEDLFNSEAASKYLVSSTEKIIPAVVNNKNAMELLGKSSYGAYEAIMDDNFRTKILNSEFVSYFDKGCDRMLGNVDSSSIFNGSIWNGNYGYNAFDRNTSTYWFSDDTVTYLGYNFKKQVVPYKVELMNLNYSYGYRCKDFYIQGSNDNSSYTNLSDSLSAAAREDIYQPFLLTNIQKSQYVRIYITSNHCGYDTGLREFKIYYVEVPE